MNIQKIFTKNQLLEIEKIIKKNETHCTNKILLAYFEKQNIKIPENILPSYLGYYLQYIFNK